MNPTPPNLLRHHTTVGQLIAVLEKLPRDLAVAVPGISPDGWPIESLGCGRVMRLWYEPHHPDDPRYGGFYVTPRIHQNSEHEETGWVPMSVLVLAPTSKQLQWWCSEDSDWDMVREKLREQAAFDASQEGGVE